MAMSINSAATLRVAVADWLNRTDISTEAIDNFIGMAEARIWRRLRVRRMIALASVDFISTASSGNAEAKLPYNFLALHTAWVETPSTSPYLTAHSSLANDAVPLEIVGQDEMLRRYPVRSERGVPRLICVTEGSEQSLGLDFGDYFQVAPIPNEEQTKIWFSYYRSWDIFNAFNYPWLIQRAPDLYLYGALMEAEGYVGTDSRMPLWAARYDAAMQDLMAEDREDRWPDSMPQWTNCA